MAGPRVRPMGLSMWLPCCLLVTLLLPGVEPGKFKCPSFTKLTDDEFVYPDPEQCDKYWTCVRGESKRSLCPDGLVFHPDKGKGEDPCDQRQNVPDKCEGRSQLQRPKPGDAHCPRQNGVYASDDPYECDTYYSCLNGKSSPTKCAVGLHYSDEIGTCVWPRESGRDDCITEDEEPRQRKKKPKGAKGAPDTTTRKPAEALANGFKCPGGPIGVHPALPHPKDCRLYYVCLDGITPSDAGCTHGKVFNPTTQQCDIPTNVEGCEFYYNPAAKKKKEEQEKKLANIAGAEVTSNDFNQFLKLLKMSGVLGGGNSVNDAFQSGLGGSGFSQGLRKGPLKGPLAGRRKRPKKLRQRPGRPRQRPLRPQQFDYYDYAPEYDYEYDEPPPRKRPQAVGSSPGKRPVKQRNRPSAKSKLETGRGSLLKQPSADLKDPVRVTPIRPTQQDETPPSIEPSHPAPKPTSSQGLFSVPQNRKSIFTSKFIPKVKAVGNLENIHPTGFSQSAKGAVTEREVKNPVQPAKKASVPQLSGEEAANLFNSLFPTLTEESPEKLPVPQPIVAPEPVAAQAIVTQPTIEEKPRRPLISSPLSRPISRASLFNRRPAKTEITTLTPVTETPATVEEIVVEVTTTAKPGILGRVMTSGRKSLFSTRNRLRSRPSLLRKVEETPTTQVPEIVTEAVPEPEVVTTEKVEKAPVVLRPRHRFPFSTAPSIVKADISEDNVINTDNLVEATPRSVLKANNPLSPRKSFRSLLKSRLQNRLSVSVPILTMKDKRPAPEPVHLPDPVVPELVTESHSLIAKQIPTTPTKIPQRTKIENAQINRKTFSTKIEPAFFNPVRAVSPAQVTTAPVTQFEEPTFESREVISPHLENSVRSRSRARGRSNTIVSQDQIVEVEPILEPKRFPKGRSSVVSAPLDTVAERERQRIIAHKVRNQIKDYLPEAENEGDAYEKLRAKIERIKNRNKARGRG